MFVGPVAYFTGYGSVSFEVDLVAGHRYQGQARTYLGYSISYTDPVGKAYRGDFPTNPDISGVYKITIYPFAVYYDYVYAVVRDITPRVDSVIGTDGIDWVETGDLNDTIFGGAGSDTIDAGEGDDLINAGAGNDIVFADGSSGFGNDLIDGSDGDDRIYGVGGNDTIIGGAGNDTLYGGSGIDVFLLPDSPNNYYVRKSGLDIEIISRSGELDTIREFEFVAFGEIIYSASSDSNLIMLEGGEVVEGTDGVATLKFLAKLQSPSIQTITFQVRTSGGTATAGADYTAVSQTVTILPGNTQATIEVPIVADSKVESDETVILTLSQPVGASLANGATSITATGTIKTDDVPTLTVTNPTVAEGNTGTVNLRYVITLSEAAPSAVMFNVRTGFSNASSGIDFTSIDRTVTIAPGTTTVTIEVPVVGDIVVESDEMVILTLSQVSGAKLANNATSITATGTIINDDAAAGLALSYRALNPDLSAAFGSDYEALIRHYIQYGRAEGRPLAGFDPEAYAALNPDLYRAFGLDTDALLSHYLSNGRLEQRKADGFDALAYAAKNPDLFATFGTDRSALVDHYVRYGAAEKRSGTGFDVEAYAALNSDLYTTFGLDEKSLLSHFVNFGAAEGRSAAGFDAEIYAALNPDLFAAFGLNHSALIEHYVRYGKAEGRVATLPAPAAAPQALSMEGLPGLLPGGDMDGIG